MLLGRKMIVGFAAGLSIGVVFQVYMHVTLFFYVLLFVLACLLLVLRNSHRYYLVTLFVLVGVLSGGVRMYFFLHQQYGKVHSPFSGIVVYDSDIHESHTQYVVHPDLPDTANVLLIAPKYPEYQYGDRVRVSGKIETPKKIDEEGRVFDYPNYLRSTKQVEQMVYFPKIEFIERDQGNVLIFQLYALKHSLVSHAKQIYSEPSQSLLSGMLFGDKQSMGDELMNYFRSTGLVHIVVLSGYNMSIIARWVLAFFRPLGYLTSTLSAMLVIVLFSLMAGGGATVWRAATMASIALFARVVGRTYVVERAFLFAFVVMILLNPSILIFDPSFQLSFLATAGLIYLVQPFDQKLRKWIANQPIREMVATMCAAQLMVLPLLLYQMGIFSLTMFPANLIVLPVVPMTMLIGLISILLSYLSYSLAFVVSLPAQLFLWYCLGVVKTFGQMHSVIFQVPAFHLWVLFLAYVFLLFVIIYFSRLQSTR